MNVKINKIILIILFLLCSITLYAGERYEIVGVYGGYSSSEYVIIYDKIENNFLKIELYRIKHINTEECVGGRKSILCKKQESNKWKEIKLDLFGDSYFGIPKPIPEPTVEEAANEKYDWEKR